MGATNIEWTDLSTNPLRYKDADGNDVWACVKKSTGCANCYSESLASRYGKGSEFTTANMRKLTPYVREKELRELLSVKKTPPGSKVFVCDMTDLFGDWVPFDLVDRIFAVFALRRDVTFQVLSKRPNRMADYLAEDGYAPGWLGSCGPMRDRVEIWMSRLGLQFNYRGPGGCSGWYPLARENFPLPNVWLGTSVENQVTANERIPHLLKVPAKVRFLSCEPLLGAVNLLDWLHAWRCENCGDMLDVLDARWRQAAGLWQHACAGPQAGAFDAKDLGSLLHWAIVGGESGPDARTFRVEWARDIVKQCRDANVPVFVKQLGQSVTTTLPDGECWPGHGPTSPPNFNGDGFGNYTVFGLKSRKAADPDEWPADLRVRQFPEAIR